MPRVSLEFDLPEEQEEFDLAYHGARLSVIIEDLDNYLRNRMKYDELDEAQYEVYDTVRRKLTELRNNE